MVVLEGSRYKPPAEIAGQCGMRISDLARIAGVTVRTLRHYYQIGLLAEPTRDSNNYRRYDVHHLIRILRIKRLSEIGFSLVSIRDLLKNSVDSAEQALAALDLELEERIKKLTRQRELIATLGSNRGALDIPAEFAALYNILSGDMSEGDQHVTRELLVLLAHVSGKSDASALSKFYEAW